jgi:hypothetical protein
MKSGILPLGCFLMLIALLLLSVWVLPQHVYDGFESTRLNSFRWSTRRLVPMPSNQKTPWFIRVLEPWPSRCGIATGTSLQAKAALRRNVTS